MSTIESNWEHVLKVRNDRTPRKLKVALDGERTTIADADKNFTIANLREQIEPWLTALFQSEHLSLLTGAGLSYAVHGLATDEKYPGMNKQKFGVFDKEIDAVALESAKAAMRGTPNIEDQIRVANDLLRGLNIYVSDKAKPHEEKKLREKCESLSNDIQRVLKEFAGAMLQAEQRMANGKAQEAFGCLLNFLLSFASRSATSERLHIFTTNYDRVIELGAEIAGLRLLDRFIGNLCPIFRSSRLDVDMHYNPPGIRGEPRYLEGVTHFTKLHGSLDWAYHDRYVRRFALPFGATELEKYLPTHGETSYDVRQLMIYPNSAKDRETTEYPYVELFRDFAAAVCRPNSTLVVYGYSFGDEHINRVIEDMMTLSSTHLVIIAYEDTGNRIKALYERVNRPAQFTLLIGNHFGDFKILIDNYLPKPAIDKTTIRMAELLKARMIYTEADSKKNKNNNYEEGENEK